MARQTITRPIRDEIEWLEFAVYNGSALLAMYPSLADARKAACDGGILLTGIAEDHLFIFVD